MRNFLMGAGVFGAMATAWWILKSVGHEAGWGFGIAAAYVAFCILVALVVALGEQGR